MTNFPALPQHRGGKEAADVEILSLRAMFSLGGGGDAAPADVTSAGVHANRFVRQETEVRRPHPWASQPRFLK